MLLLDMKKKSFTTEAAQAWSHHTGLMNEPSYLTSSFSSLLENLASLNMVQVAQHVLIFSSFNQTTKKCKRIRTWDGNQIWGKKLIF